MATKVFAYRSIKLFVLISIFLIIFSSCDIVDAITDVFNGGSDLNSVQVEVNEVIDAQEKVGLIIDDLFTSGMDTDAVKDSLASYFTKEDSVERVWINRQGVAVEYKSGIRGGIFFSPFTDLSAGKVVAKTQSNREHKETLDKDIVSLISPKKMILLASGDSEFDEWFTIESDSRNALKRIGFKNFEVKKNNGAELKFYKNLSEYGVVHFSGHGWPWPAFHDDPRGDFKDIYLLTGEKVDKITDKDDEGYIKEETKDQLLIGLYCIIEDKKLVYSQNRIWVSPQYIIDNNTFNADSTVVYGSFCYSFLGGWPLLVNDANAEVYVGYSNSVFPNKDADWAKGYYYDLTATHNDEPMTVEFWYKALVEGKTHYYIDGNDRVEVKYHGNKDFEFWKEDEPEVLEFTRFDLSYNLEVKWATFCAVGAVDWDYSWTTQTSAWYPNPLELIKSGNTYSGSCEYRFSPNPLARSYSVSITFTLRDQDNTITQNGQTNIASSVECIMRTVPGDTPWYISEWKLSMTDVEYFVNNNGDISLSIRGEETCDHISLEYKEGCSPDVGGGFQYLAPPRCSDETARLSISLSN